MIPHMILLLMDESEFVALGAAPSPVTAVWHRPLFTVNINTPRPTIHRGWKGETTTLGGFEDAWQGAVTRSIIVHANMKQPIVIQPMVINRVQFGGFE